MNKNYKSIFNFNQIPFFIHKISFLPRNHKIYVKYNQMENKEYKKS
jgi:hypothetical protein